MEVLNVIVSGGWVLDDLKLYSYNNNHDGEHFAEREKSNGNSYLQLQATYCLLMPTWHAFLSILNLHLSFFSIINTHVMKYSL